MKLDIFCETADNFFLRLGGLFLSRFERGVFFPKCKSIHTFFMRKPIDLVWLDEDLKVIRIDKNVRPWNIKTCSSAFGVCEFFPQNFPPNLKMGMRLRLLSKASQCLKNQLSVTSIKNIHNDISGQALVEASIVLPIFILIVFGFLQLGLLISEKQKLAYVTNYAVQVGSLTNDDVKIAGAINEFYKPAEIALSVKNKAAKTTNEIASGARRYNDILTVQIKKEYDVQIPFISSSLFNLEATSSARILCNQKTAPYVCE